MRVLVTGGAGFIGSHLCEAFAQLGNEVIAFDNFSSSGDFQKIFEKNNVRCIQGEIQNFDSVKEAFKNVDAVFHLAAMNRFQRSVEKPLESFDINCVGTSNVLEAARKNDVTQVVFASSSSVYGDSKLLPRKESNPLDPSHNYGASKVVGEIYCNVYQKLYGINTTALRFFSVYGPRQRGDIEYAAVIPKFISAQLEGKPLTVYGDGNQTRSFTYISDNVRANIACLNNKHAYGQIINVADTQEYSINQIIGALEVLSGKKAKIERLPLPKGDIPSNSADISKAKELLNWQPEVTLEQGLKKTFDWYVEMKGV